MDMGRENVGKVAIAACFFSAAALTFNYFRTPAVPPATYPNGSAFACPESQHSPRTFSPQQSAMDPTQRAFTQYGLTISPQAMFVADGKVLSKKRYRDDMGSVAPYDIALGWGRMATASNLEQVTVGQSGRWFYVTWRNNSTPLTPREMMLSAANMHMVPATSEVADALRAVKTGDHVRLSGMLINVSGARGFSWNTSLRRDDTGGGACEIVYVCEIQRFDFKAGTPK